MIQVSHQGKVFRTLCTMLSLLALFCFQAGSGWAHEPYPSPGGGDRGQGEGQNPNPRAPRDPSKPQPHVRPTPPEGGQKDARQHIHDPQTMKLLVIAVDGTEPTYSAIQAFLDQLGIPYDTFLSVCRLQATPCNMPTFSTTSGTTASANYYGIVMTIGNLAYCNSSGVCQSTFSTSDWAAMDSFTAAFGVRTLSYYTFPETRYGLVYAGAAESTTTTSPVNVNLTAGQSLATSTFSYLKPTANVPVENAYMYFATTEAAAGETTVPVLSASYSGTTYTVGAIHTAATGQQYLALTMDNNPYLEHSMVFNYGLFNWVTKGLFLGGRKIYLSPEVDDLFIDDDLYDAAVPQYCVPSGFQTDPTFDNSGECPLVRIAGSDLQATANWQKSLNAASQTANFKVTIGFNGIGTVRSGGYMPKNDTLVPMAEQLANKFFLISHTYDHENLDCYDAVPNSGICTPATQTQSAYEITQNVTTASNLGFGSAFDKSSMITPNVSGLANSNFLTAAKQNGLAYLVSDASVPGQSPPSANTGIVNADNSAVLEVPRYATNIFYNTDTSATGVAGSEPDEYNYFYGPNGISKLPNGDPFFSTNQTYAQITDNESQNLLYYMLRYYAFPSMFHQSNLYIYNGSTSLFIDTVQATINKFAALSNLPVTSLTESAIGALLQTRMAYNASGVVGEWTPAGASGTGTSRGSITITVTNPAVITLTGPICPSSGATCETYGGQTLVHVNMPNGTPTFTLSSPI